MKITDTLSIQSALYFISVFVVSSEGIATADTSCTNVYPSEYAYHPGSVYRNERNSANCRMYSASGLEANIYTEQYTHCDGTQLRLADSDFGSVQYSSSDYYVWLAGSSASQLLFIFPTRVNLITITLHYYIDNGRGLPRLRFYAVPDDFEVWDALSASYSYVDVAGVEPQDGRSAGRQNVSISFTFMTNKILLYKFENSYTFTVSEVEFFTYNVNRVTTTDARLRTTLHPEASEVTSTSTNSSSTTTTFSPETITMTTSKSISETNYSQRTTRTNAMELKLSVIIGVIIAISMLLLLTIVAVIIFIFICHKLKRKTNYNSSYSTLCRRVQQMQPQSVHTSNELYDQIQLSPSTGQAEFISKNETANTNNPPPHQTEYDIHPSVDTDKPKTAKLKTVTSTVSSQKENKNIPEQPTYAVVNKKTKKEKSGHCKSQDTTAQTQEVSAVEYGNQVQNDLEVDTKLAPQTVESLQDLYSVVKKKPKERPVEDDNPSPIPNYTVEELYTAVKKVPQTSTAVDNEEAARQIPPHSIDELYTAVQKKPKASDSKDEEEAPTIPAHTVEELYTAVVKKPKVTIAEDEEEIPQVPLHIMEEL